MHRSSGNKQGTRLWARSAVAALLCVSSVACGTSPAAPLDAPVFSDPETPTPAPVDPSDPVSAQRYYVSPTGTDSAARGSQSAPWRSLQYGVDQLEPGDTLVILAGVYQARLSLDGSGHSGTQAEPITLLADPGAIIDGAALSPSGQDALLRLEDVSHIVIDGLELRNLRTPDGFNIRDTPIGILVTGQSDNIEIRNTVIHDIENNSTCNQADNCGPGANGIGVFGDTRQGITNIRLIDNEVYNCRTGSSEVVVLNGNVDGFIVSGNYIHDNNNIGLDFIGLEGTCSSCSNAVDRARNGIAVGNRVINNSTGANGGNPWYGDERSAAGIYVDGGRNIIIDGNVVSGNDLGIEIASEAPGQVTTDIALTNNVIFANEQLGLALGGYNADINEPGGGGVSRIYIHNNSFYKNRGWGTEITLQYRVANAQFYNNAVFADGDAQDGVSIADGDTLERADLVWARNLWWGTGLFHEAPVSAETALVEDPLYRDPSAGDLRADAMSPLHDAGQLAEDISLWEGAFWVSQFPGVTAFPAHGELDHSQRPRTVGTIDIGAFEAQ